MTVSNESTAVRPAMILIMDGFGIREERYGNAIAQARKPNLDAIFRDYPFTTLAASGLPVGLPDGQMGNSEVGHLNIGGGRIVYQDLLRITNDIESGVFQQNEEILRAMGHVKKNGSVLHLAGLLSDGGVHSDIRHLFALLDMAKAQGVPEVTVHCFLDGRDVPPRCAEKYFSMLREKLQSLGLGRIGIVSGRYYAMDRDKRWDRVRLAYDAMTIGRGLHAGSAAEAVQAAYERGESDEFVKPTIIECAGMDAGSRRTVEDGDAFIFYNFRQDRARELTHAFVDETFEGFERKKVVKDLCFVCMTEYDAALENVRIAYPPETYRNTLGEYISGLGLNQLRIAETEKYAHVTFFFNGGVEAPNPGEDRVLIPSPKVATYDLQPEMSADRITERVIREIARNRYHVIILNFANADMVGHTGKMDAAIRAIETLNRCVPQIVRAVLDRDGQILLTADHGNADCMLDANGNKVTAHTTSPVPLCHISNHPRKLRDGGKLADIAPTLLELMDLPVPEEMTGESLLAD